MIQKTRKFTSFFLVFAILMMQITATVSAISPDDGMGSDFVGHFVSTNDNENLENIAVDIYRIVDQIHETSDLTVFDREYAFTVYSNNQGVFSFTRPSELFSAEVQIDTLPTNTSISCHSKVLTNNDYETTFFLVTNDILNPSVTETDFDILDDSQNKEPLLTFESFEPDSVSFSNSGLTITGKAEINGKLIPYSDTFEFDSVDPLITVNSLYNVGLLSETQKIQQYCNLYESYTFPSGYCLLPLVSTLQDYRTEMSSTDLELSDYEVEALNHIDEIIPLAYTPPSLPHYKTSGHFTVHYNLQTVQNKSITHINNVLTYLNNLYDTAVSEGFKEPLCETGENTIHVYLLSETGDSNGLTWQSKSFGTTSAGSIEIYGFTSLSNDIKETIAHEFFHAIQYAYQNKYSASKWIYESCAVWFGVKYSGYRNRAHSKLNQYVSDPNRPVFSTNESELYMAGPFIMAIDIAYGGTPTIERMWYNYSLSGGTFNETVVRNGINIAVRYNGDSSASFAEAYKKVGAYITYPKHFYQSIIPANPSWNNTTAASTIGTVSKTQSATLSYMSCKPFRFISNSTQGRTLSATVSFSGGSNNSYRLVMEHANGTIVPSGGDVTGSSASFNIQGFGSSITEVWITPINAAFSGSTTATVTVSAS